MPFSAEQLAERQRYLGGSEAAAAIGLSPYYTQLQLYRSKKGLEEPIENTIPLRIGHALEPTALELLEESKGVRVENRQKVVYDKEFPWRRATLDGTVNGPNGLEVVQAKSSAGAWMGWGKEDDAIPMPILYQVHHEMICAGAKAAWVPVILGSLTFRVYRVERDEELVSLLTEHEREFWGRVLSNAPPAPSKPIDLKLLYPRDRGTKIIATREIEALVRDHRAAKSQESGFKKKGDDLQLQISKFMGDAAELVGTNGEPLVTWKAHEESRLDVDALRTQQPAIAATFSKKNWVRKFLNKVKS